jgi:TRAP-type C4-dicarboxylate transport system permease small subunit
MTQTLLGKVSGRFSGWMEIAAGIALIGVMLLIGADIIGRVFGHPVPGAYELVSLAGGLIVGLALPATSRAKGQVSTDILLGKLSDRPRLILNVVTRLIGMALFLPAGYGMIMMGIRLKASGEVTAVLALPFYYVAYAVGGAFWVQILILFAEITGTMKQKS